MRAFRKEIVQNLEKINYDKKCHDLLVSSGEKHGGGGGKGTGVHMNEKQLINTGGRVSGDQGESATHLASSNYLFGGSIGES